MAFLNNFRFLTCIDILVCHEITIYIYTSSFFAGFLFFLFWNMYVGGALHRHVEGVTSLRRQYNKKGESFLFFVLGCWWYDDDDEGQTTLGGALLAAWTPVLTHGETPARGARFLLPSHFPFNPPPTSPQRRGAFHW